MSPQTFRNMKKKVSAAPPMSEPRSGTGGSRSTAGVRSPTRVRRACSMMRGSCRGTSCGGTTADTS